MIFKRTKIAVTVLVLGLLGFCPPVSAYNFEVTWETGNQPQDQSGWYQYNGLSPDSTTWDSSSPGIYNIITQNNFGEQISWGGDSPFWPGFPASDVVNVGIRIRNYAGGWQAGQPENRWFTYVEDIALLADYGVARSAIAFSLAFGSEDQLRLKYGSYGSGGSWKGTTDISLEDSDGWYEFAVEYDDSTGMGKVFVNGVQVGNSAGYDLVKDVATGSGSWNTGQYCSSNGYQRWDIDSVWFHEGPVHGFLYGDANRDGIVSAGDFSTIQSNFGSAGTPGLLGDANVDGVVSAGDYSAVQAGFGMFLGSSSTLVPEPATVSLLVVGGLAAIGRRSN